MPELTTLPVEPLLPQLQQALAQHSCAVLQAPPGAGKTTAVPLALRAADWLQGRKILMLEPRRLAARSAASYMAQLLGEKAGQTVGYRTRLESRSGPQTQIEVVTEGILTRLLQQDPALENVGLVIFDEYHERSLQADLGLALCLDSQAALRPDLRLLVMSATLDDAAVARLLDDAPVLSSPGRSYPVEIGHRPISASFDRERPLFLRQVADKVLEISLRHEGNLLVFLPGMAEIRRIHELLNTQLDTATQLAMLHGQLSIAEQDLALRPVIAHRRKIILASAIAESSLTIEGVRVVVDCGLMRNACFDPASGLTRLLTQRVSQAAADQRAGRAGRQQAGYCYRLWPESLTLQPFTAPEILQADLAPLTLELAHWGVRDPAQLRWLNAPPDGPFQQSIALLRWLGALDQHGAITHQGKMLNTLGTHPRLAHMLLQSIPLGLTQTACELAAILEERDPWRGAPDSDINTRLELVRSSRSDASLKRIRQQAKRWHQRLTQRVDSIRGSTTTGAGQAAGILLAYAYPDRIARRRAQAARRYQLSGGRGAYLGENDALGNPEFLIAAWLDGAEEARIQLAAPVSSQMLEKHHAALIDERDEVVWDPQQQAVLARRIRHLGHWTLTEHALRDPPATKIEQSFLNGIRSTGLQLLPWNDASIQLRQRLQFLHQIQPQRWPAVDDQALLAELEQWLAPYLNGCSRASHLRRLDLSAALRARLDWPQLQQLEQLAPAHIAVPSGSRIRIDYSQHPPVLAVRLQELFGLMQTPAVAGGQVPLLLHLLSPARRPVQITQDLKAFWESGYQAVKKELKGRYPKHYWPDDPYQAVATARVRPHSD